MAYITKEYYDDTFHGTEIPVTEFGRIADVASDIVFDTCNVKPNDDDVEDPTFKKAVAYETEFLYEQGGLDAVLGFSDAALASAGERLGDYSASGNNAARRGVKFVNGVPVSPMAIMLLRRLGLMCRWAYAERGCEDGES